MSERVCVALAGGAYEVVIGAGLIDEVGVRLAPLLGRRRAAVVMDRTLERLHGSRLAASLKTAGVTSRTIVIEPGEAAKSFAGLEALCDQLLAQQLERGDLVVAFGGGVVGDLAGFAAAIFKRGIDFVQIPTTLLAQVDSSIGGKTAIDTARGKNLIGAFHQPRLVLADLALLDTLPEREIRCGFAEVVKYGLLGDVAFFDWLAARGRDVVALEPGALAHAVSHSVAMKAAIVAEDEREVGARALLNLGHTFGHALEAEGGFDDRLKHGEAVALGCALAFRFSAKQELCPPGDAERANGAIRAAGLPTRLADIAGPHRAAALVAHMAQDKKARDGGLTLILARGIGQAFVAHNIEPASIEAFLREEGADS